MKRGKLPLWRKKTCFSLDVEGKSNLQHLISILRSRMLLVGRAYPSFILDQRRLCQTYYISDARLLAAQLRALITLRAWRVSIV